MMTRMASAALGVAVLASSARAQDTSITLRPGLILHPSQGVAYVMTPAGGIAAIDLSNGAARWTSGSAAVPLAVVGNRLVTQMTPTGAANRLELATLNTQARGERAGGGSVALPGGVRASVGETLTGSFMAVARRSGSQVNVFWTFVPVVMKGALDSVQQQRRPRRGVLQINPVTGTLATLDTARTPAPRSPRWVLPQAEKVPGAPQTQYESADARHVAAVDVPDNRAWDKYRWAIYDRAEGAARRIGEHRSHLSFTPFVVHNGLLIYETTPYERGDDRQAAKLRAFSLRDGREAWSVEVREMVYRGPLPP